MNKILKHISNEFSKINIKNFLNQIQHSEQVTHCLDISIKFCELINDIENNINSAVSDEFESLKKNIGEFEVPNNILNNEILFMISNLKNIIAQNKTKIKNLSSNINDIYTNLNLINSNIEKKKYTLAVARAEKIFQIKNSILINIKQLDNNQQKLLDELKYDKNNKMSQSSSTVKVRPAPTPFPVTSYFNSNSSYKEKDNTSSSTSIIFKKRVNTMSNSSFNLSKNLLASAKKKISNKRNRDSRDFSFSIRDNLTNRSTSKNKTLKEFSTMTNFYKKSTIGGISGYKFDDNNSNKKEIDDLKKKLTNLKGINEKLKKENEKLKVNLSKISNKNNVNELKNISISTSMIQNISFFNDRINKTSDLLFSLTFSFNSLQNKYNKLSNYNENEQDFSDIKKKLLNITTEISELKSSLLKITFECEEYKKNANIYNNNASQITKFDNEVEVTTSVESYKAQILNLKNKLSNEKKMKENLKSKNEELMEQIQKLNKNKKIQNLSNSGSSSFSMTKNENNNLLFDNNNIFNNFNSSLSTTTKSNSEISELKEKLRISEKKIIELKSMYESDIESKNLIENLLKKNLEENKLSYEQKIIKLKKKLEDKEKEIIEVKRQCDNEEMNLLNKIKQDNKESIEKLKNLYEMKINSNNITKEEMNKLENKYLKEIDKLNDEISKMKDEKENKKKNVSLEKSINLSYINNKNSVDEERYKKQIEQLEEEKAKIDKELKDLKFLNENEKMTSRENINKNMNEILSLKDEIIKNKEKESKLNEEIKQKEDEIKQKEEEINNLKDKNNEMKNEINKIQNNFNNTNNEIDLLKNEKSKNAKEINELNNEISKMKNQIKIIEDELNKKKEELEKEKNNNIDSIKAYNDKFDKLKNEKDNLEKQNVEISNKLKNKDKEIITLITNNNKDKKNITEKNKNDLEKAKKEAEERSKMNEQYKEQIANLQKKIFEYETSTKESDNLNEKNLKEISEIKICFEGNKLENKTNDGIKSEDDDMEEEEEEISEDENKNIDEFLEKMKKLNHKRKNDNENMKAFRKENRKMINKFLDTLDENDELKEKMKKIEELMIKKDNELYSNLKKYFSNILQDLKITNKNRNIIISFMKLMQYSTNEINSLFSFK